MMKEISLNILDVVQNSINAKATFIQISIYADTLKDNISIFIEDNGHGMSKNQINQVEDPFFTTRTTRKVGLGIPFFKYAAISTGGDFSIQSILGKGTIVKAVFGLSHIDRMPLGDMTSTILALITSNINTDFLYTYDINGKKFVLDTREFHKILGAIPFDTPEVSTYIKEYLTENKNEIDNGLIL
jgi:hypothetical protein